MIEDAIFANDGQVLRLCLRDQHAVKWVFVGTGKKTSADGVGGGNQERLELVLAKLRFEIVEEIDRRRKAA